MQKNNGLYFAIRGLTLILLTLFLFVSCSDENIVYEDKANLDLQAINSVDLAKQLESGNPGLAKGESDVASLDQISQGFEVTENGASTTLNIQGRSIRIEVPENAYDKNKWGERLYIFIRAEKWDTPDGTVYYYDCTPSGVEFNRPLILHQPYQNNNSNIECLYWYDNNAGGWVVEDIKVKQNGIAVFEIDHFSKYAIAD